MWPGNENFKSAPGERPSIFVWLVVLFLKFHKKILEPGTSGHTEWAVNRVFALLGEKD